MTLFRLNRHCDPFPNFGKSVLYALLITFPLAIHRRNIQSNYRSNRSKQRHEINC